MWRLISRAKTPGAGALSSKEFEPVMARFAPFLSSKLAIAVSGGPDSMALAYLAKEWAAHHNIQLHAFIVDHALREESASEAKAVQKQLDKLGIPAEILLWKHEAIVSKLHITARKARYRLLTGACKKAGISALLLAHQLEDQAETVLMRLAKGSGIDGLAGITAENKIDDIRLLRPLLAVSKERLIATCRAEKIPFVTDPSNRSEKYARGRLRRVMPLLADEGLTTERLADLAARAADASDALDHYTKNLLRVAGKQDDAGTIRLDLEQLRSAPRAIALRAVAACLQQIHTGDYAPEHASLASLADALCADEEMPARTLHGCLVSKTEDAAIFIREFSAITESIAIQPGETVIWDGRWQISLAKDAEPFTIGPLGNPPHETVDKLAPVLRRLVPQGRARAGLPALLDGKELIHLPALDPADGKEVIATARLLKLWPPR